MEVELQIILLLWSTTTDSARKKKARQYKVLQGHMLNSEEYTFVTDKVNTAVRQLSTPKPSNFQEDGCLLVACGSYNPITFMHLRILGTSEIMPIFHSWPVFFFHRGRKGELSWSRNSSFWRNYLTRECWVQEARACRARASSENVWIGCCRFWLDFCGLLGNVCFFHFFLLLS